KVIPHNVKSSITNKNPKQGHPLIPFKQGPCLISWHLGLLSWLQKTEHIDNSSNIISPHTQYSAYTNDYTLSKYTKSGNVVKNQIILAAFPLLHNPRYYCLFVSNTNFFRHLLNILCLFMAIQILDQILLRNSFNWIVNISCMWCTWCSKLVNIYTTILINGVCGVDNLIIAILTVKGNINRTISLSR